MEKNDILTSYRLTSLEEPTDEQLQALMKEVGEAGRESSRHAKAEIERRFQEVRDEVQRYFEQQRNTKE